MKSYKGTRKLAKAYTPKKKTARTAQINSLKRSIKRINDSQEIKYTTKYVNDWVPNSSLGTQLQYYSILLNPIPPSGLTESNKTGSEWTITSLRCRFALYPLVGEDLSTLANQLIRIMVIRVRSDMLITDGLGVPNIRTFPLNYNTSASALVASNQVDYISSSYNVDYAKNFKIMYDKVLRVQTGVGGVLLKNFKFKMHKKMEQQDGTNTNDLIYFLIMADYRQSGNSAKQNVKFGFECKQSYTDS